MSLKLFVDYVSQPSRAVLSFCLIHKIPFTLEETRVVRKDHLKPEFTKLNPHQMVPVILHGDFVLSESHAILAYLASVFPVDEHWYPKNPQKRALIDSYLHWHHLNTRFGMSGFLYRKYLRTRVTGKPLTNNFEEETLEVQKKTLAYLNSILGQWRYVGKTDALSIADLACFCECEQLKMIEFDYSAYPNLERYMQEIGSIPGVAEAHKPFHELLPKIQEFVKTVDRGSSK